MKSTPESRLIEPEERVPTPKVFSDEEPVRHIGPPPYKFLNCCLLHMIRDAAFRGESVKLSMDSTKQLVRVGARVVCHDRNWYVHVMTSVSPKRADNTRPDSTAHSIAASRRHPYKTVR